jgi:hypothetical protein
MSKDNALSFVGQIMTAYKAVMKAEGSALKYAIECGEALNFAKENVESTKPKGKWNAWLKEHCKEIPPRTERLYRQLASAVADDADIFSDCESIRDAVKKLQGDDDEDNSDDDQDAGDADDAADEEQSGNALPVEGASPDLTTTLHNTAVDEVYTALTQAWEREHIRDLANRLLRYLGPPTTDIPTALRRPLPQPTL